MACAHLPNNERRKLEKKSKKMHPKALLFGEMWNLRELFLSQGTRDDTARLRTNPKG